MMLLFFVFLSFCLAHDLRHELYKEGRCLMVRFYFTDGTTFSYENYQIFRPNESIPFQVGKTDALGRVVFCPDGPGRWTLKTFSEDGHGAVLELEAQKVAFKEGGKLNLYQKILVGAGMVLGVFGLYEIYLRRILPWLRRYV